MRIWIDVEDASGNRYGNGAILTATGWTSTRALDAIGTFSFAVPATDPVLECDDGTHLLTNKRYVRCWSAGDDPANLRDHVKELGAGIIERIDLQLSENGATMLQVSGVDLLSELSNTSVGDLALFDDELQLPVSVYHTPSSGASTLWTPGATINLQRDPLTYIYVRCADAFSRVTVDLGSPVNTTAAVLQAQYYNTDSSPNGWEKVQLDDETIVSGKTLAKDGYIDFAPPSGWGKISGNYIIRFFCDTADITPVQFNAFHVTVRKPTLTALQDTMDLAPTGWTLDPAGKLETEENTAVLDRQGVYQQMNKESAMATLGTIAEQIGEHFILSPTGRRVLWLGTDKNASGLRAVGPANPQGRPDPSTLYITDLQRTLDSYPLFTRIYAAGGGTGEARITLSDATTSAPAGYTLNTLDGWLQNDAAVAEFGRIDNPVDYPDIVALDNSHDAQAHGGNALLQRAYEELKRGSVIQEAYQISVLPALYPLYPGSTIYVSYHQFTDDGFHAVNIEKTLWVLDVQTKISPSGAVYTVGLTVALVDTYPVFDGMRTAQAVNAGRSSRAVTPPNTGLTDSNIGEVKGMYVKNGLVTEVVKGTKITPYPDGVYPLSDTDAIDKITIQDGRITMMSFRAWQPDPAP